MPRRLVLAPLQYPFAALFGAILMGILVLITPSVLHAVEPILFPVNTEWKVTRAERIGNDLVLMGTMRKHRACIFMPPTIARDNSGRTLQLIHGSPGRGGTWAPDDEPQIWGPWTVVNGAGKVLEFTNVFQCHALWPTFSELGSFDARKM